MKNPKDYIVSFSEDLHPVNLLLIEGGGGEHEITPKGQLPNWALPYKGYFNVFRAHYPLSNDAEGVTIPENKFPAPIRTVKSVIRYMKTISNKPIVVLGHSMGATYAMLSVLTKGDYWEGYDEFGFTDQTSTVAGVVSINGVLNWGLTKYDVNESRPYGENGDKEDNFFIKFAGGRRDDLIHPEILDATSYLNPSSTPTLLVMGDKDIFYDSALEYIRIAENLNADVTTHVEQKVGHFNPKLFEVNRIRSFVRKVASTRTIAISGDFNILHDGD